MISSCDDLSRLRPSQSREVLALAAMAVACAGVGIALLLLPPLIVAAGTLALMVCAAIAWRPHWGATVTLMLLYIPVEVYLPRVAAIASPLVMSALTFFAYTLALLRRREQFRWRAELGWVGMFGVTILLATAQVPGNEVLAACAFDVAKLVLMFTALQQLLNSEDRAYATMKWLVLAASVLALVAVYGWVTGSAVLMEHGMPRAIVAMDNFDDPNDLAAALVIAVPLALLLFLRGGNPATRFGGVTAFAILVTAIALTNSRGGMLALGVALVVMLQFRYGWTRPMLIMGAALGLLLVFGPDRFNPESVRGDDSAIGRLEAWQAGLEMLARDPLFGVGYDQFERRHIIPAHNSFIHALGEGGLLNGLAWVGMNYWALLTLIRLRRWNPDPADPEVSQPASPDAWPPPPPPVLPAYGAALQAALMASLTAGMFLSHGYRLVPLIPVALAAALGGVADQWPHPRRNNLAHYVAIPAILFAGIVVFYVIVRVSP